MARTRWSCPNEKHPAVLGPTKPRRDASVRFCLACSAESARLVPRVALAVEKARAERGEKIAARNVMRREKARANETARFTHNGVDLRDVLRRVWALPTAKEWRQRRGVRAALPRLHVRHASGHPRSRLGFARPWAHYISVTVWGACGTEVAISTLIHEVAHILDGQKEGTTRPWHGASFEACERALLRDWNEARAKEEAGDGNG